MTLKSELQVTQNHSNRYHLKAWVRFPIHFYVALSYIICEIKRDIGRKAIFFIPALHSTYPLGGSLSEYCHPVLYRKTKTVELPDGENFFEDMYTVF